MKIKIIALITTIILSFGVNAQTKTLKAFYSGYDEELNIYSFEDAEGEFYEFIDVKSDVLKSFDLKSEKLVGKAFIISYISKEIEDEEGFSYEKLTITKLQTTTLKKQEVEEFDEEYDEE